MSRAELTVEGDVFVGVALIFEVVDRSHYFAGGGLVASLSAVELDLEGNLAIGVPLGKQSVEVELLRLDEAGIVHRSGLAVLLGREVGVDGAQVGREGTAGRQVTAPVGDVAAEVHVTQAGYGVALLVGK